MQLLNIQNPLVQQAGGVFNLYQPQSLALIAEADYQLQRFAEPGIRAWQDEGGSEESAQAIKAAAGFLHSEALTDAMLAAIERQLRFSGFSAEYLAELRQVVAVLASPMTIDNYYWSHLTEVTKAGALFFPIPDETEAFIDQVLASVNQTKLAEKNLTSVQLEEKLRKLIFMREKSLHKKIGLAPRHVDVVTVIEERLAQAAHTEQGEEEGQAVEVDVSSVSERLARQVDVSLFTPFTGVLCGKFTEELTGNDEQAFRAENSFEALVFSCLENGTLNQLERLKDMLPIGRRGDDSDLVPLNFSFAGGFLYPQGMRLPEPMSDKFKYAMRQIGIKLLSANIYYQQMLEEVPRQVESSGLVKAFLDKVSAEGVAAAIGEIAALIEGLKDSLPRGLQ